METMSMESIKLKAPAVFATSPVKEASDRYYFISTKEIIDTLKTFGWQVTSAQQQGTHKHNAHRQNFKRHLLRFRNPEIATGENIPEIVVMNSHDRSTRFKFYAGIFRTVCMNGLIIAETKVSGLNKKHIGHIDIVNEFIESTIEKTTETLSKIREYKNTKLTQAERISIARQAIRIHWPHSSFITPEQVLEPRREEDKGTDLWTTFNVIQENIMKGGMSKQLHDGRVHTTREVKNVTEIVGFNIKLWKLFKFDILDESI